MSKNKHGRKISNYLIDKKLQLRYVVFVSALSAVICGTLGYLIWQQADVATNIIREQLAGDEFQEVTGAGDLPDTPAKRVVAMTFLRLAPFTEPRGDETRHEMLSEMTSTVGSVFLGLTVGCAKCHYHKHD